MVETNLAKGYTPTGERFKDIAELIEPEGSSGKCLGSRIEQLAGIKNLGPPDLVHIIKNNTASGKHPKECSSYHFITGVDTSSSATIAAYLTSLSYALERPVGWMTRTQPWNIAKATYCCYNAFIGQDIWVEARIPGGVSCRLINRDGTTSAISSASAPSADIWLGAFVCATLRSIYRCGEGLFPMVRRLDLLKDATIEGRFFEACAKLLPVANQLTTSVDHYSLINPLIDGITKFYIGRARPLEAKQFLVQHVPTLGVALNAAIGRCILEANQQSEAIQLWYNSIVARPNCTAVLHEQIDFLLARGKALEAEKLAQEALRANPIDWMSWIKLARAQVHGGKYDAALISLNNCPLNGAPEPTCWKLVMGTKIWSPIKEGTLTDELEIGNRSGFKKDTPLDRLRASSLRGPVKEVYTILVELVQVVGWDDVLKLRSSIFLMEEECANGNDNTTKSAALHSLPVIGEDSMEQIPLDDDETEMEQTNSSPSHRPARSKRMCERWLDALFMILFEDLRLFTLFQTEQKRSQAEKVHLYRTQRDWLLLGDLARRLLQLEESIKCYRNCVAEGFCRAAWLALAALLKDDLISQLEAVVRVLEFDDGHYNDLLAPSSATEILFCLIKEHGLDRIKASLVNLRHKSSRIDELVKPFLEYSVQNQVLGYDY